MNVNKKWGAHHRLPKGYGRARVDVLWYQLFYVKDCLSTNWPREWYLSRKYVTWFCVQPTKAIILLIIESHFSWAISLIVIPCMNVSQSSHIFLFNDTVYYSVIFKSQLMEGQEEGRSSIQANIWICSTLRKKSQPVMFWWWIEQSKGWDETTGHEYCCK